MQTVSFSEPMPVTNARCCSSGSVQCPRCAQAALAATRNRERYTATALQGLAYLAGAEEDEDLEILELPVFNWDPDRQPRPVTNARDDEGEMEILELPVMNWAGADPPAPATNADTGGMEVFGLPVMNWDNPGR